MVEVADKVALEMYIAVSVKKLGDIDIVVANVSALTVQDEVASWQKAFDVDMMHTVRAVNAAMPCLEKSKHGTVLTVSSVSGSEVDFTGHAYGVFKAELVH